MVAARGCRLYITVLALNSSDSPWILFAYHRHICKLTEEVCSFLNAAGRHLLTGVNGNSGIVGYYHKATLPAMPKSMVAVFTPSARNTLRIVGMVML